MKDSRKISWRKAGGGCSYLVDSNECIWIPRSFDGCEKIILDYYKEHPYETPSGLDLIKRWGKRRLVAEVKRVFDELYREELTKRLTS